MKRGLQILIVVTALLTLGCSTIVNGPRQTVRIESCPSGATVVAGAYRLTTPGALSLSRHTAHSVEVSKTGYETQRIHINRQFSTMVFGNVLLLPFAVVGLVVDFFSGCGYDLSPTDISVVLTPTERAGRAE